MHVENNDIEISLAKYENLDPNEGITYRLTMAHGSIEQMMIIFATDRKTAEVFFADGKIYTLPGLYDKYIDIWRGDDEEDKENALQELGVFAMGEGS